MIIDTKGEIFGIKVNDSVLESGPITHLLPSLLNNDIERVVNPSFTFKRLSLSN
jgi:hypothetical protein